MADLKKLMLDEIRKNTRIQSSYIDETEELIDTGLEKTDDNLTAVACAYLDEKGYRRRVDNLEIAKSKILETSEGYDTIIVKKNRIVETNIFEKATVAELRDALEVCMVNTIYSIHTKIDRLTNKQYEYKVEYVDSIKMEEERPKQDISEQKSSYLLKRHSTKMRLKDGNSTRYRMSRKETGYS